MTFVLSKNNGVELQILVRDNITEKVSEVNDLIDRVSRPGLRGPPY